MNTKKTRKNLSSYPLVMPLCLSVLFSINVAMGYNVPTNGLTAHWNFDDNLANAVYASGNSVNGPQNLQLVPVNGAGFETGLFGQAAHFDGTDDYLEIFNPFAEDKEIVEDAPVGINHRTISVWFKADTAPSGTERFMVYETAPNFTFSLGLREATDTRKTKLQVYSDLTSSADPFTSVDLPDSEVAGQWVHVLLTYRIQTTGPQEVTLGLVVNNTASNEITVAYTTGPQPFSDFHVGTYRTANGRFFPGTIDELAVWERELTPAEQASLATTTVVVTTLDDEDDGADSLGATADISLREALVHGQPYTPIQFDPSLSGQTILLTNEITVSHNRILDASDLPGGLTLDAQQLSRLFIITHTGFLNAKGLTLTGGHAGTGDGGAIQVDGGKLDLTDCTLSGNTAVHGGAINSDTDLLGQSTTLTQCTLSGNHATIAGGAIHNYDGFVRLQYCTISGNSAPSGSGVSSYGDDATQTDTAFSIISGNQDGDDVAIVGGDLINNSFFSIGYNVVGMGNAKSEFSKTGDLADIIDPQLAPLGSYGGPTQTMPPLYGSPAIDAGVNLDPGGNDQRGFPRFMGGVLDIGSVESSDFYLVDTVLDENDGTNSTLSLREAVTAATTNSSHGSFIQFSTNVFTGANSLSLTLGQINMPSPKALTLFAGNIFGGITIDAGSTSRIFYVGSNAAPAQATSAVLYGLTLLHGWSNESGGAIHNENNTLLLNTCSLRGNSAGTGGAIHNDGSMGGSASLYLNACTLTENSAGYGGGAIRNNGETGRANLHLTTCTISGNTSGYLGGGIENFGVEGHASLHLINCTLTQNSAPEFGGGIHNFGIANLNLDSCIIAQNTALNGPDIFNEYGSVSSIQANLIGNAAFSSLTQGISGVIVQADPQLAPLRHYGGPTKTRPPLFASPAIDAGRTLDPGGTDQRGAPGFIGSAVDLGAVESSIILVNTAADENDGIGVNNVSLREAVAADNPFGTLIQFSTNVFLGTNTITLTHGEMKMSDPKAVNVYAGDLPNGLIIDAGGSNRIFNIQSPDSTNAPNISGSASLHNLTLFNGIATDGGGAIINRSSILHLTDCSLTGNTAGFGGAIAVSSFFTSAALLLDACTLNGNQAGAGGAIHTFAGNGNLIADLRHCTFSGNSSSGSGGAITHDSLRSKNGHLNLTACTLTQNTASSGGGLYNGELPGFPTINLTSCIIAQNASSGDGPDIFQGQGRISSKGANLIGNTAFSTLTNGVDGVIEVNNARLGPLSYYGGPTQTTPPNHGSPAINAGSTIDLGGTDQRGLPRFVDGAMDLGAVESQPTLVFNNNDNGAGSLRHIISIASPGFTITFHHSLSGQTILLTSGQLVVDRSLTITASAIGGITIDGNGDVSLNRIFEIMSGTHSTLDSLTLIKGFPFNKNQLTGGAILLNESAVLNVWNSTITQNIAVFGGGGIMNSGGLLFIRNSTISDNQSNKNGGGIYNSGDLIMQNSTLSENRASDFGGAIFSDDAVYMDNSTLSENNADHGGGMYLIHSTDVDILNTIISGNRAGADPNLFIHSDSTNNVSVSTSIIDDPAFLAPLGDYGGPTQTMPPLPGSPAIDAGDNTERTTDQRGLPLVGTPDIGSAEYQGATDNTLFWSLDTDGDGNPFGVEFALGTDWNSLDRTNAANLTALSSGGAAFGFNPAASNHTAWVIKRSRNLLSDPFVEIYRYDGPTGLTTTNGPISANVVAAGIEVQDNSGGTNAFYQFSAEVSQ